MKIKKLKLKRLSLKINNTKFSSKRCKPPNKITKVLGLVRDTRKNIEKGQRKIENEKYKKNQKRHQ